MKNGDEPMTAPQASYRKALCHEAKVDFLETLTKAQAPQRIDEFQKIIGRGRAPENKPFSDSDREVREDK
jgi:hypothetical protein